MPDYPPGKLMSLLMDERTLYAAAELLLSSGPLDVWCQVTVEWLRGIGEPTWYGYFVPMTAEVRVLPGRYHLTVQQQQIEVLVRRPAHLGDELCFPFWGLGAPPNVPPAAD
jgi:hypothetical protein